MSELESQIVSAWREAARDLGIRFTAPFALQRSGRLVEQLGFVHQFGRRLGTVIAAMRQPSSLGTVAADDDYFFSQLSGSYARYDRQLFVDTLDDWQFFGPASERPAWYSGKSWT